MTNEERAAIEELVNQAEQVANMLGVSFEEGVKAVTAKKFALHSETVAAIMQIHAERAA